MRQNRKDRILIHLQENLGIYLIVTAIFTVGIITGALSVRMLSSSQIEDLNQVFFRFVDYLSVQKPLNQWAILQRSLLQNGIFILLFWLCGTFFFGFVFALGLVYYRGFTIGFTVGFLTQQNVFGGIIFAVAAILPQNLVYVPATIAAGVFALSLSFLLCRRRFHRQHFVLGEYLLHYSLAMVIIGLSLGAGSLLETVISPVFMRIVVSLL